MNALQHIPLPLNEPVKSYAPGSPEKAEVKAELARMRAESIEIPLIIGGQEVRTGVFGECRVPHDHGHVLARYHKAGQREMRLAIDAALAAWRTWSVMSWEERASISLKAAELISKKFRAEITAATMLGQSKTVYQAEIDAVCELCDFLRFNTYFMQQIFQVQPENFSATWNRLEYRPLEGFVFAVSPFNFTAIGGNLAMAPAVMGNVCVWKPSSTAVYSSHVVMRILREAGLPDGVINFVPGDAAVIGEYTLKDRNLAGLHFTGSNAAFDRMWKAIGEDVSRYRSYPRIVGETGGKDFVVAHRSAEVAGLATCLIRGAFEYQGQKCSATSRAYIAQSLWRPLLAELKTRLARVKAGPVEDFTNFMGAVIDKASFENIKSYIEYARTSPEAEIVHGGVCDDSKGHFIEPTVVLTTNPRFKLMEEEIFGPVLWHRLFHADADRRKAGAFGKRPFDHHCLGCKQ